MLKLRQDIKIAWDVLHLLNDDYEKIFSVALRYKEVYNKEVSFEAIRKLVWVLASYGYIESKKGVGIRRSMKKIIFLDEVIKALTGETCGVNSYSCQSPSEKLELRLKEVIKKTSFDNSKIIHNIKDK